MLAKDKLVYVHPSRRSPYGNTDMASLLFFLLFFVVAKHLTTEDDEGLRIGSILDEPSSRNLTGYFNNLPQRTN